MDEEITLKKSLFHRDRTLSGWCQTRNYEIWVMGQTSFPKLNKWLQRFKNSESEINTFTIIMKLSQN